MLQDVERDLSGALRAGAVVQSGTSGAAPESIHLRDVLARLWPGNPECDERFNPKTGKRGPRAVPYEKHTCAFNMAASMVRYEWEGAFSRDALEEYAANVAVREASCRLAGETGPLSGDAGVIDNEIRRLHRAGLTGKILAAVKRKYRDVAKATGLDEAKARAKERPPVGHPKKRFKFSPGLVKFDDIPLDLPSGLPVEVLSKLVQSFGQTVQHQALHEQSHPSEASGELRGAIRQIRKALEAKRFRCEVVSRRSEGYLIRSKS